MDEQRKKRLIAKYSKSSAKMPGGSGGPGGPGGPRPGPGGGKMKVKKPQDTKKAIARLMGFSSFSVSLPGRLRTSQAPICCVRSSTD